MRIEIGYRFMLGFIAVIASVAFIPYGISYLGVEKWLERPLAILGAITIGLILGTLISRGLTRGFHNLVDTANSIGYGDLTKEVVRKKKFFTDETTDLAEALNRMLHNLKELVGHIRKASTGINQASKEIEPLMDRVNETVREVKEALHRIDKGAKEQEERVAKARRIIGGIDKLSSSTASYATEAVKVTTESHRMVRRASDKANTAIDRLEKVFFGIERAKDAVAGLEEELETIPRVLEFITHISRQTDLLAINASIEASKAGEYGKGFSNVAEEVRRFADSTERSSKDIAGAIKERRLEIRELQKALAEITVGIDRVDRRIKLILRLSQQQRKGVHVAVETIEDVSAIAGENLSIVDQVERKVDHHFLAIKEVSSSFDRLEEMAQELEEVVKRFKVEERREG